MLAETGGLLVVQFAHGILTCEPTSVKPLQSAAAPSEWSPALHVLVRSLALAIRSVNDQWGVFSASRIALLPHQLWVCKRVLEQEPARWLIADDVGLGKTIEAGLILSASKAARRLDRYLVIAPASLCEQWQRRLGEQFDLRTTVYRPENDTPTSHFWEQHQAVVASLHTLRDDRKGRHQRLLEVEWDLVIVDEAHHLHADKKGWTLAYRLLHKLVESERARSILFFTGTPHRGKNEDFFALLALLRPDLFDPKRSPEEQLPHLRQVMVRNNKQLVTDMRGQPLFVPTRVRTEVWHHSPEEQSFYGTLTEYIIQGRAFASGLALGQQRTAMLVLTAIQKLASSSVAAVRRALRKRLERARKAEAELERLEQAIAELTQLEDNSVTTNDARAVLEEAIAELFLLGPEEVQSLETLVGLAGRVQRESRIERILELLQGELAGRAVLFFTEYKATQALLVDALNISFGVGTATFINGDGFLEVLDERGERRRMTVERTEAARRFNRGEVRFLVSTEAAGEGIDLHHACHTLVHVDMPWNPMRMHQRSGRLNRYGQKHAVDIISMRNPETVEARIWDRLQSKLHAITEALGAAMEAPEDMMQLVLGLESPGFFERLYAEAPRDPSQLSRWFDAQTATFGGEGAVQVVRAMLGEVARFDFQEVGHELPRLDLPDLMPFLKAALVMNRRDFEESEATLGFIVPEEWKEWGVLSEYRGARALVFSRDAGRDGVLAGVGLRVIDKALDQAAALDVVVASTRGLDGPLAVYSIEDARTEERRGPREVVVGAVLEPGGWRLLRDGELISLLNGALAHPRSPFLTMANSSATEAEALRVGEDSRAFIESRLDHLSIPYRYPRLSLRTLLFSDGRRG